MRCELAQNYLEVLPNYIREEDLIETYEDVLQTDG